MHSNNYRSNGKDQRSKKSKCVQNSQRTLRLLQHKGILKQLIQTK
jgi:hypothetical protein